MAKLQEKKRRLLMAKYASEELSQQQKEAKRLANPDLKD